jgi:hypothetical protein
MPNPAPTSINFVSLRNVLNRVNNTSYLNNTNQLINRNIRNSSFVDVTQYRGPLAQSGYSLSSFYNNVNRTITSARSNNGDYIFSAYANNFNYTVQYDNASRSFVVFFAGGTEQGVSYAPTPIATNNQHLRAANDNFDLKILREVGCVVGDFS